MKTAIANTEKREQPIEISEPLQALQTQIGSWLVLTSVALFAIASKEIIQPWIKKQSLKLSFNRQQDEEIEQILTILLDRTQADRVLLTRFTNGVYTIDGASIKGCTVTHEITQIGLTKVSGQVNARITNYSNIILKSFMIKGFGKRITEEIEDVSHRAFLEELHTKFSVNYFLAGNDLPLGFISFHWRSPNNRMDFESVSQNEIRPYADAIISKLLSNQSVWTKFITNSLEKKK